MEKLLIISGFSGSGKGTVIESLMRSNPHIWLSISDTDRQKRNDTDRYHFVNTDYIKENIACGNYMEYNKYGTHYYASPRKPIIDHLKAGHTIILEIDIHGMHQVYHDVELKMLGIHPVSVFITVGAEALANRLIGRGDSPEEIRRRLQIATKEAEGVGEYDYILENRDIQDTVEQLEKIILGKPVREEYFNPEVFKKELDEVLKVGENIF